MDDGIFSRKCNTSFIDGLFWGEVEAQFKAMRIYVFDKEKINRSQKQLWIQNWISTQRCALLSSMYEWISQWDFSEH